MKELTRKLNPSTFEVDPNRFLRTYYAKIIKQQRQMVSTLVNPVGVGLLLSDA
jgi:hypothetical protein